MPRPTRERGFTLLEVLVVIVIVGVLVTLATLTLGDRRGQRLEEESARLAALIGLAQEEAVFQSREMAVSFWQGGYAFHELVGADWQLVSGDSTFQPRRLPDGMSLRLYLDDVEVGLSLVEKREPQVFLLSSGETSAFELVLEVEDGPARTLTMDLVGNLHVEALDEPWR